MTVLGIDPGLNGALALYVSPNSLSHANLLVWDMPTQQVTVNKSKRRRVDLHALLGLLDEIDMYGVTRCYVEQVSGMAGQGSGFDFGFAVGALHMALAAKGFQFELLTPGKWKKDLKVPKDKGEAVVRAKELFPGHHALFHDYTASTRGKARPDRAEAAMIALWGSRT